MNGAAPWPFGDSEMAARIRAHEWAATPLGARDTWPQSLRTLVDLILGSPAVMAILWGQGAIQIFNDGYAQLLGPQSQTALGRSIYDTFPKLRTTFEPPITAALAGNRAQLFAKDVSEDARHDITFSPLRNESGELAGVFVLMNETTARSLDQAIRHLQKSDDPQIFLRKFSDMLRAEPDADAIAARAVQILAATQQLDRCFVVSFQRAEGRVNVIHQFGRADLPPLPAVFYDRTMAITDVTTTPGISAAEQQALAASGLRAFIALTVRRGENNPSGAIFAGSAQPRQWTPAEVALLEEATERTWAAIECARAAAALRDSESKYRGLFESIDTGYCVIEVLFDEAGKAVDYVFLEANPAFEKQAGLRNAIGKRMRVELPAHEEFWFETYGRIARSGQPARFEHRADALDRWFSVYAFRVGEPAQHQVAVLFEDIEDRKRRELHAAFLDKIGKELPGLASPDEIMAAIGARIGEFLNLSRCIFCDVDAENDRVTVPHGWTAAHVPSLKQTFRPNDYLPAEFARANRAGESFVIRDTSAASRSDRENYARLQIGAFVVMPIFRNGRWTAYFAVSTIAPRDWRRDELELLKEVSQRLFSRLETVRADAVLRESEARQTFLLKLSDGLRPLADANEIRALACQLLGEQLNASRVYYCEYAPKEGYGIIADDYHIAGLSSLAGSYPFEAVRSTYERIASGVTWIVPDVRADTELPTHERAFYAERGILSWVRVPLAKNGTLEALLCTVQTTARRWTAHEIGLVEDTAERLWSAIQRGRAEAAQEESETRFAQFARASAGALWIRDADTLALEYASPAIATIYGVAQDAFLGDVKRWAAAILPEDREAALQHIERAQKGEAGVHEFRIQRATDQVFRWIRSTSFPLRNQRGAVERIGGIFEDVSEAKLAIEHQSVLLAELQHRVRNIMAIIRSVAARTGERAESVKEYATLMAGRLFALARVQALLTRAANVGVDVSTIVRDELGAQAPHEGQYDVAGPDLQLSAKAAEVLTLALHELATNALKYGALAVPQGRITVRWKTFEKRGTPWFGLDWSEAGAPARPAPDPALPRRRGFGSELIEGRIPYELGGRGRVEIGPAGAECHLEFPLGEGASILETDAPQRATVFGGTLDMSGEATLSGQRILIVEDDYYLATDAARGLRGAGATVLGPVPTEEAALSELESCPPTGAVVDINLGAGASFKLAQMLKRRGIPFLLITGYDEQTIPAEFAATPRLQKPVELKQIVSTLAQALAPESN